MARKPRIHQPGGFYHAMLRGNGGDTVFFSPGDRLHFYSLLGEAVARFGCRIHAFCLMNNHVHLAIQVGEIPLSKIMQTIAFRYTRKINRRKKRIGHLFQGRYKAILVDENSYLLELVRYIHLNPVRADITQKPADWRWSGHNAYLGKERIEWLTTDAVLGQFGARAGTAKERYAAFIAEGCGEASAETLRTGSEGGRILGEDRFVEKTLKRMEKEEAKKDVPFKRVLKAVAEGFGVPVAALLSASRERRLARARAAACLLAREHCRITLGEIGRTFGRDIGGLSRAVSRYAERLDGDAKEKRLLEKIAGELSGSKPLPVWNAGGDYNKSTSQA